EQMLTDALDGTLSASDAEAFAAHSKSCGAGCGELLEEAKRGGEWLRFLRETPEAPEGLLEKILVGTSGLPDAPPLAAGRADAEPDRCASKPVEVERSESVRVSHVAEPPVLHHVGTPDPLLLKPAHLL